MVLPWSRPQRFQQLLFSVAISLFLSYVFCRSAHVSSSRIHILKPRASENISVATVWQAPGGWDPIDAIYGDFERQQAKFNPSVRSMATYNASTTPPREQYNPYTASRTSSLPPSRGPAKGCQGPRGRTLSTHSSDEIFYYRGVPRAFPEAPIGSSSEIGLDQNACFERHGRYSAYGLQQYSAGQGSPHVPVDWSQVSWGSLQNDCVTRNRERFDLKPRPVAGNHEKYETLTDRSDDSDLQPRKRTAVLFRAYDGMSYTSDMLRTMRAVITELSLGSGGEYVCFLLVQVKDKTVPIFEDHEAYQKIVYEKVPKEFWNITILWNESLWPKLYPFLPESTINVHLSQWLPVQWFATRHPSFDHYWNWEMDIRYTGHYYELAEMLDLWTSRQPRKGLWERNSRFWIPKYHGNYSQFREHVQGRYVSKYMLKDADHSIWGPQLFAGQERFGLQMDPPKDRLTPQQDNFEWGVGEDADLITLLPMFNPDTTHYVFRDGYYNYPPDAPAGPPRRTTIITFFRLSNRLLNLMHLENSRTPGHHMSSETWPQSVALQHGLKGVYAPHPIFMERLWPPEALDFVFNNGDSERIVKGFEGMPVQGEGSGGWESVFGLGREHNFEQSTWYYRTGLATRLYKRFLGYEVEGIGGRDWEAKNGLFCLPPMLLHQIKALEDPVVASETPAQQADRLAKAEAEARKKEQMLEQELNAVKPGPKVPQKPKHKATT